MAKEKAFSFADMALQSTYTHDHADRRLRNAMRSTKLQYRTWLKQANRYVLEDDFIDMLAQSASNHKLHKEYVHLGRLPYPVVWVEYDQRRFYRKLIELGYPFEDRDVENLPDVAGLLCVRDPQKHTRFTMFKFDKMEEMQDLAGNIIPMNRVSPLYKDLVHVINAQVDSCCIQVDCEDPLGDYGIGGTQQLLHFWGRLIGHIEWAVKEPNYYDLESLLTRMKKAEIQEVQHTTPLGSPDTIVKNPGIEGHYCLAIEPGMMAMTAEARKVLKKPEWIRYYGGALQTVSRSMTDMQGVGLLVSTLFALINNVPIIERAVRPTGFRTFGMNRVNYLSHSVVTLKIPKKDKIVWVDNRIRHAYGETRARHTVSGHWAHRRRSGKMTCDHVWVKTTDVDHEECTLCGMYRWWRKDCERGDASKGFVQKDGYRVTARSRTSPSPSRS